MNNLVKQKLRNWIFNQRKWRFFTERFSKLFNHLNNTPLDEVVATIAQEKLGRMIKNLDFLRKSKISFNVKQIGWMWLQVCWEKIITNTGYTSIQEIFDELQLENKKNLYLKKKKFFKKMTQEEKEKIKIFTEKINQLSLK